MVVVADVDDVEAVVGEAQPAHWLHLQTEHLHYRP
jgi:hypothetical protein